MLKALRKNGSMLVLGLNPKEVEHLKQGNPLTVKLDDVGAEGNTVVLFMGASDEEMKKRFERSPLAEPETLIDLSKVRLQ
jgi:hypothetical protein